MEGEPYKIQHEYHQRAAGFLNQALAFDEQSSKLSAYLFFVEAKYPNSIIDNDEMAILLYKQGIRELEKAVQLKVDANSKWFLSKDFLEIIHMTNTTRYTCCRITFQDA